MPKLVLVPLWRMGCGTSRDKRDKPGQVGTSGTSRDKRDKPGQAGTSGTSRDRLDKWDKLDKLITSKQVGYKLVMC